MTTRPGLSALIACLLLVLTACTSETTDEAAPPVGQDPHEWVNRQFSEKQWGLPEAFTAAGGIAPGSEAGTEFTPAKAGWYAIGMTCNGPSSMSVTIKSSDGELGSGRTACGAEATTTMELPAGKITATVDGVDARGMWALAFAPTEAPTDAP